MRANHVVNGGWTRMASSWVVAIWARVRFPGTPFGASGGIAALVKARGEAKPFDPVAGVELGDYAGVYSGQPWDSDYMLIPWAGGLTWLDPDSGEPARRVLLRSSGCTQ